MQTKSDQSRYQLCEFFQIFQNFLKFPKFCQIFQIFQIFQKFQNFPNFPKFSKFSKIFQIFQNFQIFKFLNFKKYSEIRGATSISDAFYQLHQLLYTLPLSVINSQLQDFDLVFQQNFQIHKNWKSNTKIKTFKIVAASTSKVVFGSRLLPTTDSEGKFHKMIICYWNI